MNRVLVLALVVLCGSAAAKPSAKFVRDQANASRVKNARAKWTDHWKKRFGELGLKYPANKVLIRSFKHEGELELWAADGPRDAMTLVEKIPVCAKSGGLGPKRQQGDLQVPEGFYVVDRFNAWSSYHLSLGVNYPNQSDRKLGKRPLGGDIFIHGDCVTIGCIPIEDEQIQRVYVAALDSYVKHGRAVEVHILPTRMDEAGRERLRSTTADKELLDFWNMLEPGYRAFEETKVTPKVRVDKAGRYVVTARKPK
jgi:murein L,D-transpeptidase YafK